MNAVGAFILPTLRPPFQRGCLTACQTAFADTARGNFPGKLSLQGARIPPKGSSPAREKKKIARLKKNNLRGRWIFL
jgi:hypothetical protein